MQTGCQKGFFKVCQGVKHLSRALGVAQIEYLLLSRTLLDHLDVGYVIIAAELGPAPLPKSRIIHVKTDMLLAEQRAAVIPHVHIVAGIGKLERHWVTLRVVGHPICCVHTRSVLNKDRRLSGLKVTMLVTSYMESCENEAIIRFYLDSIPSVFVFGHQICKPLVLIIFCKRSDEKDC